MAKEDLIKKVPFGALGRGLVALLLLEIIAIWVIATFASNYFAGTIPAHYGLNGAANGYGDGSTFYLLGLAFSIAAIIILLVAYFRYELINEYPYMINMPAFYYKLSKLPQKRKAYWINRYFEAMLVLGVCTTLILIFMIVELFYASQSGFASMLFVGILPTIGIVLICALLFVMLRNFYRKISEELKR